ncbi:MAG: type II secretion system protein [Rhodospirillales bacterium]|nr:type II secretion system protein [Rhodospirillales bacterium]
MSTRLHRLIENRSSGRQQGFTLLEIAIVMVVVALLMGMGLQTYSSSLDNAKRKTTTDRMDKVEEAITAYVIQNNYVPCPADGSLPSTNVSYGISLTTGALGSTDCDLTYTAGARVIPWRTLGLDELYSRDGWGNRISYMTAGASQAGATTPTTINFTLGADDDGMQREGTGFPFGFLIVNDLAGTQLTNSGAGCSATNICAAYVLISHGAHAVGAYTGSSTPAVIGGVASVGETANNDGATPFVQNIPTEQASASGIFDDIVRWRSAQSIVSACGTGACGNN